jgi:2-dehydro-3-deoxygluconokinase
MKSLGFIGECMLELRQRDDHFIMGYGGDVFNAAVYATRTGANAFFISAIGDDHYSSYLLDAWQKEGVNVETVRVIPHASPALYIIETDDGGERSFSYWRDSSPFKSLLKPGNYLDTLSSTLAGLDCIYFSGISLAVLPEVDRETLLDILKSTRSSGKQVAFDPNYRPKLWASREEALKWIDLAYSVSDIALPSFDDEFELRGAKSKDHLINQLLELGPEEIVVKHGKLGAIVSMNNETTTHDADVVETVIDTTAAGDSFNGAYLAHRMAGVDACAAAKIGCRVAGTVIQHQGAIIPDSVSLLS